MSDRSPEEISPPARPLVIEVTGCPDSICPRTNYVKNCKTSASLPGHGSPPDGTPFSPPDPISKGRDWWFNEYLTLPHAKRVLVSTRLLPLLLEGERRKRKRREKDNQVTLSIACAVIANALKADRYVRSRSVCHSRGSHTYYDGLKGLYYPNFMSSKVLRTLVDQMVHGGWLTLWIAKVAKPSHRHTRSRPKPPRSTYQATNKLLTACEQLGISHETTYVQAAAPVLILRDKNRSSLFYRERDHKEEIFAVHRVNRFLSRQKLTLNLTTLDLLRAQYEAETNEELEEEDRVLDLNKTRLRRIFNNSDWRQGGRFYGGGWQSIRSEWRSHILINGNPTVELDYHGFLIRAIYHAQRKTLEGDPYDIPAVRAIVDANGDQWETVRPSIKRAVQALIYAKWWHLLETSPNLSFPTYLDPRSVLAAIEAHHVAIKDQFRSNAGMLITNRESRICQSILTEGVKQGIPVLPIHDSYVVEEQHVGWLYNQMREAYWREFGAYPEIRSKTKTAGEPLVDQLSLLLVEPCPFTPTTVAPVKKALPTDSVTSSTILDEEDFLEAPWETLRDSEMAVRGLPSLHVILDSLRPDKPR